MPLKFLCKYTHGLLKRVRFVIIKDRDFSKYPQASDNFFAVGAPCPFVLFLRDENNVNQSLNRVLVDILLCAILNISKLSTKDIKDSFCQESCVIRLFSSTISWSINADDRKLEGIPVNTLLITKAKSPIPSARIRLYSCRYLLRSLSSFMFAIKYNAVVLVTSSPNNSKSKK